MARPVVAAFAVSLVSAAPAQALDFNSSTDPETVVFPITREITYRLEIVNGPVPERLTVFLRQPLFDPGGDPVEQGSALERVAVRYEGPGEHIGTASTAPAEPVCSRPHGYALEGRGLDLSVPPFSVSSVTATYRPPLFARWPGTHLSLVFEVTTAAGEEYRIRPPVPRLTGPRGVELHVALGGARAATTVPAPVPLSVRRGQRVRVEGRASRRVVGRRVALRIARRGGRPRTFARPRVRASGRFGARRWRAPRRPGTYEIHASYRGDGERLMSDRSCGKLLEVR